MKTSKQTIPADAIPEHVRRLNPAIFGDCGGCGVELPETRTRGGAEPKRTRNGLKLIFERLNKTELRWLREIGQQMIASGEAVAIHPQVTFCFDDGTKYTVDFLVVRFELPTLCVEVKGGYTGPGWEQGHERFRRARDLWQHFDWEMHEWRGKEQIWKR
jgi:hypothetical protein